jgi:glucose dehydrogenase
METGDNLGQIKSELKKDEIIVEVVCAGLKNYAYKTYNAATREIKTVCKVRGITLNYSASQLVNFKKIKDMILNKDDETVIVRTENKIKRKKIDGGIHLISEPEDKTSKR